MRAELLMMATVLVAMLLSIVDMPNWSLWARPEWVLLVVFYWVLAAPERFGIFTAALIGLLQDSLTASLLGRHVLAYSLVVAVVVIAHKRLRMFDVWQQAGVIFLLIGIERLIKYWIDMASGLTPDGLWFLFPAMMSALIWPWLLVVLRTLRRRVGVIRAIH